MMRIIYDNDAASDDIIALLYLLSNSNISIEGITIAGTGEAHGPMGAINIADICHLLGKENIPIAYGCAFPCDSHGKPFPEFLRKLMDDVLKDLNIPSNPNANISKSAVELIKNIIISSEKEITILATGPLTNIADFIKQYPELTNKIEKIVIMGGAVNVPGNIQCLDDKSTNTVAEWNIYADPKAAEIVFSSKIPVVLVPLDATNQVPMTKSFYDFLSLQYQPSFKVMYQLLKVIVDGCGGIDAFLRDFYLWDPLAAMVCVEPAIATTEKMHILMDLENSDTKCVAEGTVGASVIDVATKINQPELILQKLLDVIKTNNANVKSRSNRSGIFTKTEDTNEIIVEEKITSLQKSIR